MSDFSINCFDFKDGEEIPKKSGYKHGNEILDIFFLNVPQGTESLALIMDDPDAMKAVGKVWVHWLLANIQNIVHDDEVNVLSRMTLDLDLNDLGRLVSEHIRGKNDFGELEYGGPAPPDGRHTYIFKAYALDAILDLKEGYSKQELEDTMKGHIIGEAKLTGTFAP